MNGALIRRRESLDCARVDQALLAGKPCWQSCLVEIVLVYPQRRKSARFYQRPHASCLAAYDGRLCRNCDPTNGTGRWEPVA